MYNENRYCIVVGIKFCDSGQNAIHLNSVNFIFGDMVCQPNNDITTTWTVLCYHPYLVSILFADLLSLHLVTFL